MGNKYQLVGSADPASRIDRAEVEAPSGEYPSGLSLQLNGEPVELNDDQVAKISGHVQLRLVNDEEAEAIADPEPVSDANVQAISEATPDFDGMSFRDLQTYLKEHDVPDRAGKNEDELRELAKTYYNSQEA